MPVTIGGSGPITGVTSINTSVSDTELGYLDGVTSALQTQIDGKPTGTTGAWTAYTPTWTNLTVGNATQASAYVQVGKFVSVRLQLTWGSTTSITGTGVDFSLPLTAKSITGNPTIGLARFFDANGSTYSGTVTWLNTTTARLQRQVVSGSEIVLGEVSSTSPYTWTSTDQIHAVLMYEAA